MTIKYENNPKKRELARKEWDRQRELEEDEEMIEDTVRALEAYKEGYKDGYNAAVQFYIVNPMKNMNPDFYKCPICGVKGVHMSVCVHPKCPTRVTC